METLSHQTHILMHQPIRQINEPRWQSEVPMTKKNESYRNTGVHVEELRLGLDSITSFGGSRLLSR